MWAHFTYLSEPVFFSTNGVYTSHLVGHCEDEMR